SGIAFPRLKLRYFAAAALVLITGLSVVSAQRKPAPVRQPKSSVPAQASAAAPEWPQWGGPHRNFKITSGALQESWPAGGPKQLWSRPLGEGHSSILVDNGRLYTMYSSGNRETVISLDATTGKTIWEYGYEANTKGLSLENGRGPHSTPL